MNENKIKLLCRKCNEREIDLEISNNFCFLCDLSKRDWENKSK